jgi:hypothetical protein
VLFQFVSQLSQHLLPEQAWAVIKDFVGGVKDSLPTEELRELISAVETYVSKVCMHISESNLCVWLVITSGKPLVHYLILSAQDTCIK